MDVATSIQQGAQMLKQSNVMDFGAHKASWMHTESIQIASFSAQKANSCLPFPSRKGWMLLDYYLYIIIFMAVINVFFPFFFFPQRTHLTMSASVQCSHVWYICNFLFQSWKWSSIDENTVSRLVEQMDLNTCCKVESCIRDAFFKQ